MTVVAIRNASVDADLARREAVIEVGLRDFLNVGRELTVIREQRLYYQDFETFEDYCQQRWLFSDSRARQFIGAVATVTNVTALGAPAPASESQARALTGLTPDDAAKVMVKAHEDTNGKPTAKAIREAREVVAPKAKTEPVTEAKPARKPRRKPLTDQARDAGWELRKSVERLERLAKDDRFNANKEAVAPHLRGHLTNAIEACQGLLDRINN